MENYSTYRAPHSDSKVTLTLVIQLLYVCDACVHQHMEYLMHASCSPKLYWPTQAKNRTFPLAHCCLCYLSILRWVMWCWHCKWMAQWYSSIGSDSILTSRFHLRRISTFPWWPCTCINSCLSCSAEVSRRHRVKSVIFCIFPLPHLLQAIWGIKKKKKD